MSSAKSSAMFFIAPEPVTKAVPLDDGTGKRARMAVVSNSSSSVPKPPGMMTNASAYLTNIVLRAKK